MSRREYPIRLKCTEPGCTEGYQWTYATTRKEEDEIRARYNRTPYRCIRHTHPEEVLSADNTERTSITVCTKGTERYPDLEEHFFGNSGFVYGPGFKAYASDFPPGTRLIITARVELPEVSADV